MINSDLPNGIAFDIYIGVEMRSKEAIYSNPKISMRGPAIAKDRISKSRLANLLKNRFCIENQDHGMRPGYYLLIGAECFVLGESSGRDNYHSNSYKNSHRNINPKQNRKSVCDGIENNGREKND
ncbi:hypothetical protein HQ531_07515 [bacterium]|nr:hypothetical protein [bacterium]